MQMVKKTVNVFTRNSYQELQVLQTDGLYKQVILWTGLTVYFLVVLT